MSDDRKGWLEQIATRTTNPDKIYVGIDPGKNGGIAIIDGDTLTTYPTPLVGDEISGWAVRDILTGQREGAKLSLAIEKVGAMPGQGVTSMFSFGFNTGLVTGIAQALAIPYITVRPQEWQKIAFFGIPVQFKAAKSAAKSGKIERAKQDPKAMAAIAAKRLFPSASFLATERSKVPHDGMIDAALIAYWLKLSGR